ncbi:isochorismatase [Photobacterium aquae]|uniref:Isochorismatase n=1 Tax=Photobacterium aquae TaxID=1195763 RepID=A0A0J1GVD2_9GAMM|nr:hydrolase [Photobacterium aquae]KLV03394.1 isochorismatase [Photobacterium aquae]
MLTVNDTALVIVDVQGKLAQIMDERETLFYHLEAMVKGAKLLGLPIIWVEQLPDKLGATIPEISQHLVGQEPIAKSTFSCYENADFVETLNAIPCKNLLVMGIEAHICVYQTVKQLLNAGYHVEVVTDAISSRSADNKALAIAKMQQAGAHITGTEMVLFELQHIAEGERFKELLKIIK